MREYKYDNLKFVMIFFVVFGHCLELIKGDISKYLYIIIYTFSMPTFVYISGYFAKCTKKNIIKYTSIYLVFQTIYYLLDEFIFGVNAVLLKPNWVLWYMFSLVVWLALIKLFDIKNKKVSLSLIAIMFIFSILAGFVNKIGYAFSLSRIITFFPYFLLGYYTRKKNVDFIKLRNENGKFNIKKIIFWGILFIMVLAYFWQIKYIIKASWLYGSMSYKAGGYGYLFKIMWIILSLCEIVIFDNFVTNKKLPIISTIGANTLYIFLLHGIVLKFFKYKWNIFAYSQIINLLLAIAVTAFMLVAFGGIFPFKKSWNKCSKLCSKK